jgi:hypothetical protein
MRERASTNTRLRVTPVVEVGEANDFDDVPNFPRNKLPVFTQYHSEWS